MILTGPGTFTLRVVPGDCCAVEWASMSASQPSFARVWVDDVLVEDACIGPYGSPHTWWSSSNGLLGRQPLRRTSILIIELGDGVKFRIEGDLAQI